MVRRRRGPAQPQTLGQILAAIGRPYREEVETRTPTSGPVGVARFEAAQAKRNRRHARHAELVRYGRSSIVYVLDDPDAPLPAKAAHRRRYSR